MDDKNIILKAEDLTRVFGPGGRQVRAVDGVSFSLERGEIVSIVGESGSGKSTLARLMLGLLPASSGTIMFDGDDISHMHGLAAHRAYWRKVQAIFQDPFASFNQFFSVQRVLNNALRLSEKPLSPSERSELINRSLESVKLSPDDVLAKIPHELSGGQRQRVMIARAIMLRPHLLIADEPTTMIDASSRATVLNVLLDLHEEYNPTIVFITHDISLAAYVSDRLFIMHDGKIVERGGVDQVMKSSQDPYTKQLFSDTFSLAR